MTTFKLHPAGSGGVRPDPSRYAPGVSCSRIGTLLARALLLAALPLWASQSQAASYYFSDCPTGGAGTQANPWCLDPEGAGRNDSFRIISDGGTGAITTELAAGDTVYLCAGACDGQGSAIYHLSPAVSGVAFIQPRASGASGRPITIRSYPGETVTLTGDTNGNGVADPTEPDKFLDGTGNGANRAWWVWQDLIWDRWKTIVFYINEGASNWTFSNIEVKHLGHPDGTSLPYFWNDVDMYDASGGGGVCDNQVNSYIFKVADLAGPLIIQNSRFHHVCGFAHRDTVNDSTAGSLLMVNNEYYNLGVVSNDFIGRNTTYRGNNIHDVFDGVGIEENMKDVVVEDNTVSCPGAYRVSKDGRCGIGIKVTDGDNGTGGTTKNVTLRRNKLYSLIDGVYGGTAAGYWMTAILFNATNSTESINSVIENNMIWHVWTWDNTPPNGGAITVNSNRNEITIQNNTVYDSTYGMTLDAKTAGVAYTVRNNLLVRANKNGQNFVELWVGANAANSVITFNNLNPDGQADPVMNLGGVTYKCSQMATFLTGNKCGPTSFVRVTGAVPGWDLHLASSDISDKSVWMTGPTLDIDQGPRSLPGDIGADEFGSVLSLAPTAALSVTSAGGQPSPTRNGIYQLKAGTYTVLLTTTGPVTVLPTPLALTDNAAHVVPILMSGSIPGSQFTGTFTIGGPVVEGAATFSLPTGALNDGLGNLGNQITSGGTALIDMTPPSPPRGVATQ